MGIFGTDYESFGDMFDGGGPGASNMDSDGKVISYDNDNDPNNEVTGIAAFSNTITGNSHANDGYGDDNSDGYLPNYQVTMNDPSNGGQSSGETEAVGQAPSGIMGFSTPAIIGKIAGWLNGTSKDDKYQDVDVNGKTRRVYTTEDGNFSYSYNFLGMPYELAKDADGNWQDKLKLPHNAETGELDLENGTVSGYDYNRQKAKSEGDNEGAADLDQYEEDNSNEDGEVSDGRVTAEAIRKMAEEAGLIANAEDAKAIIADPMKFLEDRGLKLSDIMPTMSADGEGTTLDPTNPNYGLGDDSDATYNATTVDTNDINTVDTVEGSEGTTYDAATVNLTENEMVDPVTGEIRDENLVEDVTIDTDAVATGVNADGTTNHLGVALNEFASIDLSNMIDTTTVQGKLLAQKYLDEGKTILDAKTSVQWWMKNLSAEFKDANGQPTIPVWAQAMHRDAMKSISFNGISGSAATATMANAIMESMLTVADKEASFYQKMTEVNLNNKQEAIINRATILSKIDLANLDVRSQAAVQNAKAFLEMDLTNLSNEQKAELVNKEALVQALFDNTAAENAARRFGAEVANDMQKFYDELNMNIQRHNSSEINALLKFNAGEINDAAQFNADIRNDRAKFMAEMQYQVDLANAKWRQTVETENFRAEFDAATADVKAALDLTQEQQNQLWDYADNLLDYIWKTTDNDQERELRLLIAQMQAQSGQKSGGGFWSGLLTLGGAFLGSSSGSAWLAGKLSDERLKENIQHYDTLKGINFYTWDWTEEAKRLGADKYPSFGVLAQEVQKTHPKAVKVGPDGYLMVNYGMIHNDL